MANSKAKKASSEYQTLAAQFAAAKRSLEAAKRAKAAAEASRTPEETQREKEHAALVERQREALELRRKSNFEKRWLWAVAFWIWVLLIHTGGIAYFTSGFLLTRLVLDEKSACDVPPPLGNSGSGPILKEWPGQGTWEGGCWHPKTFDRAVVVLIDALRYDFTIPVGDGAAFHDAFPFLHKMATSSPSNAFLRPFIADPPTTTLLRLKGLTTGTMPAFIDAGSSFAGTAIEEDNLLVQLRDAGKRVVHVGDDTWEALFPGYFEPNMSHAYPSFDVWDLHTVDNGVIGDIFPLMDRKADWDVLISHCLGVDHAGHRYGPDHPAMTKKLAQMDDFIAKLAAQIDDQTVLIVMGDHGMDAKGDHGGESDDEIEAALWMYSPKAAFGRTHPDFVTPPTSAKIRPVNQIDLVPTLALLLGIPIPFNNLGRPIEEAFAGVSGVSWDSLASAERTTAAGIKRYQASYFAARGLDEPSDPGSPADLWAKAVALVQQQQATKSKDWQSVYAAFTAYQEETLRICKGLWARFDIPNMILGIVIMVLGVVTLLLYISRDEDEEEAVLDDLELDLAERSLEMQGVKDDSAASNTDINKKLALAALVGALPGLIVGLLQGFVSGTHDSARSGGLAAVTSTMSVVANLFGAGKSILSLVPKSLWTWMAVVFTLSQSIGFASNSYTIWEDSISLFFLTSFGLVTALASFRLESLADRYMGIYHSILFVVLGNLASYSKLCREEQMPYCMSTFYVSENSSTSATWQLAIPFTVFLILPSIIKAYMLPTRSYEGLAPTWVGYVFRTMLFMSAAYWTLDAADNGRWLSSLPEKSLKNLTVYDAQLVLGIAVIAGGTAFAWAPPCVNIQTSLAGNGRAQVTVLGFANAHGARYLLLPLNVLGAVFLLSKPMGGGALALMMWQILSLAEILDLNGLTTEPIGPVVLALLGNFLYFKTGHQATLSSIQWDIAFVPLFTVRIPWSPLAVMLNHFSGQILATAALPLLVLWKVDPRRKGVLTSVIRALGAFVAYYAVESTATMAWAGWLRRHLMLYRVFSPRFMMAAAILLVVDVVAILVALAGVRVNMLAIAEVFGWAE